MRRENNNLPADAAVCRIFYWQGYVTGQYYAQDRQTRSVLGCSARFRTWSWQHGNRLPETRTEANAALTELLEELRNRGWRVAGFDVDGHAAQGAEQTLITEEAILRALNRIGGDGGATAAELGLEIVGSEVPVDRHLPQRVAAKLRRLQVQGKVERRQNGRGARWFSLANDRRSSLA